ncbi:uncharacterized protein MELLADRAFT_89725 [Melampsora larici-populina 98AG31]|uniref:Helicase C-terminal domain-containing protein n=1 Tax=Melampsora larici-populina (strain 98AG31 / pathotype 3-4-7) TaxID=747676 RepID=F4RUE1_MELLP|nr:uncharacterized protein MELLADRAFT_89725 [Melampsora larici-populina 98AG31]EGG04012.1 hypothetical protein MELLADRAFT_89725 [Melampsora larici-populina 98AG31]
MAFEASGIRFCQLHGNMSTFERTCQLNPFTKDPVVEAFVVLIEAGGVGLNMTCADEVYLMDAHWNPQVVQQAVDHLHHIGQTRPVRAFHVVTGQSIEQHLYNVSQITTFSAHSSCHGSPDPHKTLDSGSETESCTCKESDYIISP